MNWRLATSALLVSVALSGAAAQQSPQPDPLVKLNEWRRPVQNLIDSAKAEGLPWNALRLKAIYGINMKYNGRAIVEALRKYYHALEQSRAALGPMASAEEVETGASVLAAGVNTEDLAKFRVAGTGRSPMRPL